MVLRLNEQDKQQLPSLPPKTIMVHFVSALVFFLTLTKETENSQFYPICCGWHKVNLMRLNGLKFIL